MVRLSIIWLLIMTFAQAGIAQIFISGRVVDGKGVPISKVEVYESKKGNLVYTDSIGRFSLQGYQAQDRIDILFISEAYKVEQRQVLIDQEDVVLEVAMAPLVVELNEVIIRERRALIFGIRRLRDVEGTSIYAGKKTEVVLLDRSIGNLATGNPRQIYNQVVGLNIYESTDGGLQLNIGGRGLDPNRTANFNTRQNGYDISADVLGYPESYYTPPVEALEEIQVVRGAASLQYGTQFGGLLNFKLRRPSTDKIGGKSRLSIGSYGLRTTYNNLSGTAGDFAYSFHHNYKKGDGFRLNSNFSSNNVIGEISYQLSDKTSLTAEYTFLDYEAQQAGGISDAQFYLEPNFSNRERNFFKVDWSLWAAKLQHRFSDNNEIGIQFSGLNASRKAVGFRTNRVSQPDIPGTARDLIDGRFKNWSAELRYIYTSQRMLPESVWLVGVKYYRADNASFQGPGSNGDDAHYEAVENNQYPFLSSYELPNRNTAIFSEWLLPIHPRIDITPGIRAEFINTGSEGSFTRRSFDLAGNVIDEGVFRETTSLNRTFLLLGLGIGVETDNGGFYINLSQNYRSVTFSDLRIVNPAFQVDPDLRDERGYTLDLGFKGRLGNRLLFDTGIFAIKYNDRIGEILEVENRQNAEGEIVSSGRIIRLRTNIGDAVIYGWEGMAEGTLLKSQNSNRSWFVSAFANVALTYSEYLSSIKPGVMGNEVEFIPRLNIKTGLRAGWNDLLASVQYTSLASQFTDATNAPQIETDNQRGIEGSIPQYNIMDLALTYKIGNVTVESGINNLLNSSYFTRRATGYPGPGIIPSDPRSFYLSVEMSW